MTEFETAQRKVNKDFSKLMGSVVVLQHSTDDLELAQKCEEGIDALYLWLQVFTESIDETKKRIKS